MHVIAAALLKAHDVINLVICSDNAATLACVAVA
jgi:hypothetical protein